MKYQVYFINSHGKRFWLTDCDSEGDAFGFDSDFTEGSKAIHRHIDAMNDLKKIRLKEKYGEDYDEEKANRNLFKSYYSRMWFNESVPDMSEIIVDVGSHSEFYVFKKVEEN